MAAISAYEHALGRLLWSALEEIPAVRLWGVPFTSTARAPTVSFTLKGQDHAAGCAAARRGGNLHLGWQPLCAAPDRGPQGAGWSTLRVGFSMYNTAEEAMRLIAIIKALS